LFIHDNIITRILWTVKLHLINIHINCLKSNIQKNQTPYILFTISVLQLFIRIDAIITAKKGCELCHSRVRSHVTAFVSFADSQSIPKILKPAFYYIIQHTLSPFFLRHYANTDPYDSFSFWFVLSVRVEKYHSHYSVILSFLSVLNAANSFFFPLFVHNNNYNGAKFGLFRVVWCQL